MKNDNGILWIINGGEGFGISRATVSIAGQFRSEGVRVKFISLSKGILWELLVAENFEVDCLEIPQKSFYNQSLIFFLKNTYETIRHSSLVRRGISDAIKGESFNSIIYRSPNLTSAVALLSVGHAKKFWIMPNEISNMYPLGLNKRLYQLFARMGKIHVIANSKYTATTIRGWGIEPHVLYLGVDPQRFNPSNPQPIHRSQLGFEESDIIFGVFARFDYTKAQDLVIEAFSELRDENPSVKLLLVGADPQNVFYKTCTELIRKFNLDDFIVILETVKDIENYYPLVDVVINSRRDAEPFGLTIIESMLMEKPVIALAKGGPSETVIHNHTGWLIPNPTKDSYKEGLKLALKARPEWKKIGKNARGRALNHFTSEEVYRNLKKIISDAVTTNLDL